jgi:hypothetical protein
MTPDKIREFKDLPPEEKLNWLEDANNFIRIAVSPEKMQQWELLRDQDIQRQGKDISEHSE